LQLAFESSQLRLSHEDTSSQTFKDRQDHRKLVSKFGQMLNILPCIGVALNTNIINGTAPLSTITNLKNLHIGAFIKTFLLPCSKK